MVTPNLPTFSSDARMFNEEGKNQPSIRAKSRKPSCLNNVEAPFLMQSIMSEGKRGGVW